MVNIYNDGTIKVTPTALINIACKTAVGDFPFDEKRCKITLGR